ncbi:hypothetical protein GCM10008179_24960 [Hansschlegelia plantiphila]|uniref:Ribosomal RNA small subunit methyltransferase G n=1 Tax=Hansschlegelia plantiphila TaxID=374655 RepID=A0A9W6J3V6_9HYPH|nr:hypothetical protein GCM10008179_24960 [Hansschlegelia plantiphila]
MTPDRTADRAAARKVINVSRETLARLDQLVFMLDRWQATMNLVAPASLPFVWTRHVADSFQLLALAPTKPDVWVDLGSGAGFPGLVVAAALPGTSVHLVESNVKKAAFLREASRAMGVGAVIHAARADAVVGKAIETADIVSARALSSLSELLGHASPLLKTGAVGLFPKGREVEAELTAARECWRFNASLHPSLTDAEARIVRIDGFDGPR